MLTPQEVQDKKFIKAVFGGYDMVTVDEFLEKLTEDYTALFKENTVLKNKLKVLVETVEEYRSVDESMRRALLGAQKIAKDMVNDAKAKSAELMESANKLAETKRAELDGALDDEYRKLDAARAQTARFIDTMRTLFKKQIDLLDKLPETEVPSLDANQTKLDIKREIENSVKRISSDIPTASLPNLDDDADAAPATGALPDPQSSQPSADGVDGQFAETFPDQPGEQPEQQSGDGLQGKGDRQSADQDDQRFGALSGQLSKNPYVDQPEDGSYAPPSYSDNQGDDSDNPQVAEQSEAINGYESSNGQDDAALHGDGSLEDSGQNLHQADETSDAEQFYASSETESLASDEDILSDEEKPTDQEEQITDEPPFDSGQTDDQSTVTTEHPSYQSEQPIFDKTVEKDSFSTSHTGFSGVDLTDYRNSFQASAFEMSSRLQDHTDDQPNDTSEDEPSENSEESDRQNGKNN